MGLALYRKYRPSTFAEVVGQDHVTGPLTTAVDSGRINHAYLFSGPRGCGKTSSARILARSLNCEQGPTSTPCGVCQSCRDLAPDGPGNIDVIEIDAASHGGVEDARELRERAFQLPVSSRYKVYIIDEAHMVTNQGFNALLKVVEEPPDSVIFIFATTEPDKVLATIRSRTHHYPFRLVPPAAMRTLLQKNCVDEGVDVQSAVLPLIVRAGGGSVRDSQSLLDQLMAGAGPDGVSYADALALLGVTDSALLDDIVEAIGVGDGATVFGTVDRLVDAGHDPRRFASDLLDRLRDLILLAAVPDAGSKGLVDVPEDQLERLSDQAGRLRLGTLSRLADLVHVGLTEMRGTTAPRLGLELICARMLLPQASGDTAALTQRVDRLERRMQIGASPADSPAPSGTEQSSPPANTAAARPRPRAGAAADATPTAAVTPTPRVSPEPASAPARPPEDPSAGRSTGRSRPGRGAPAVDPVVGAGPVPDPGAPDASWPEIVPPGSGRTRAPAVQQGPPDTETPVVQPPAASDPVNVSPRRGSDQPEAPRRVAEKVIEQVEIGSGTSSPPPADAEPAVADPVSSGSTGENSVGDGVAAAGPRDGAGWDAAGVRRIWPDIVQSVKARSRPLAAMVAAGSPVGVAGDVLTVAVVPGLVRRLADPAQQAPVRAALQEVLGVDWKMEIVPIAAELELDEVDPRDEEPDEPTDASGRPTPPIDPEEAALNLLRAKLGASPLES